MWVCASNGERSQPGCENRKGNVNVLLWREEKPASMPEEGCWRWVCSSNRENPWLGWQNRGGYVGVLLYQGELTAWMSKQGGEGACVCVLFENGYLGKMDGVNEDGRGGLKHVACFSISQRRLSMRWARVANCAGASALKPDAGAKAGAHSQTA